MLIKRLSLADGRTMNWREAGQGPTLVLMHGWAMTGAVFSELAGRLSNAYRVLMPDLPGHGHSSAPVTATLEQMAADLGEWLKHMTAAPCLVCGWSLGGMIAMQMVAAGLASAQGLVLMATTPQFTRAEDWPFGLSPAEVKLLDRNLAKDFHKALGGFFHQMFAGENLPVERLRAIRKFAIYPEAVPKEAMVRGVLRIFAMQDQRCLLNRIPCPVLVLHGSADQIVPVGAGRFLAGALAQARLQEYPGIGHAPFFSQPAMVAEDIRSFAQWIC